MPRSASEAEARAAELEAFFDGESQKVVRDSCTVQTTRDLQFSDDDASSRHLLWARHEGADAQIASFHQSKGYEMQACMCAVQWVVSAQRARARSISLTALP
jgi:hypothetical protein